MLRRCKECASEWLEGPPEVPEEFWYDGNGPTDQMEAFASRRAAGHLAFLRQHRSPAGRLLDVGCGWGAFVRLALEAGWDAEGREVSPTTASYLREHTGLPIFGGDLRGETTEQRWDVITLWGVVEHVPNPQDLLAACAVLLKPGGCIALETPNAQALFRIVGGGMMRVSAGRFTRPFEETLGAGHLAWYSRDGLHKGAAQLGLKATTVAASTNDNELLAARFAREPAPLRTMFSMVTIGLNSIAPLVGRPNQLSAILEPAGRQAAS